MRTWRMLVANYLVTFINGAAFFRMVNEHRPWLAALIGFSTVFLAYSAINFANKRDELLYMANHIIESLGKAAEKDPELLAKLQRIGHDNG